MSMRLCDRAAFAIIVAPGPGPNDLIKFSLNHWRHIPDAREPTEVQELVVEHIESDPETGLDLGPEWVKDRLAPALDRFSLMLPKDSKVAIFVPEFALADIRKLRDAIQKKCPTTIKARNVTFEFEQSTGPLDSFLTWPGSQEKYVAVYTVKPVNVLTIYKCSGSSFTRLKPVPIGEVIDVTNQEDLENRVKKWVKTFLRPKLTSIGDSSIQLVLPTEDLCANPFNTYNSVRDQIMRELLAIGGLNITLAGSSDVELSRTMLDRLFNDPKSKYITTNKFMISIEYASGNATAVVHRWTGTSAKNIAKFKIRDDDTIPDDDKRRAEESNVIETLFADSIKSVEEHGGDNMISIPIVFSRTAGDRPRLIDAVDKFAKYKSLEVLVMSEPVGPEGHSREGGAKRPGEDKPDPSEESGGRGEKPDPSDGSGGGNISGGDKSDQSKWSGKTKSQEDDSGRRQGGSTVVGQVAGAFIATAGFAWCKPETVFRGRYFADAAAAPQDAAIAQQKRDLKLEIDAAVATAMGATLAPPVAAELEAAVEAAFLRFSRRIVVVDAGSSGTRAVLYRWTIVNSAVQPGPNGPFPHPSLPWMAYVGEVEEYGGIHERNDDNVVAYLDSLFTKLNKKLLYGVKTATTPLIGLATGGMRGQREAAQQEGAVPELLTTYDNLLGMIQNYFLAPGDPTAANETHPFRPQRFNHNKRSFKVINGEKEAIYGWITANYSMGRLEVPDPDPSYGFLEMGGQSVQIAYEVPMGVHPTVKISNRPMSLSRPMRWIPPAEPRVFRVFTKMISGLGAKSARKTYLATKVPPATDVNRHDRCSIQDQPLFPGLGSGLGEHPDTLLGDAGDRSIDDQVALLNLSLNPVHAVVSGAGVVDSPTLLSGAPAIPIYTPPVGLPLDPVLRRKALADVRRFVGGSSFWHANRSLYPQPHIPTHSFNKVDLNNLIRDFAAKNWSAHIAEIARDSVLMLGTNANVQKVTARTTLFTTFREASLFCAMLVHAILYEGIQILPGAPFQPFDGVVGLYNGQPNTNVPYSWTLAVALIEATSVFRQVTVTWVEAD